MPKVTILFRGLNCFHREGAPSTTRVLSLLPNVTDPGQLRVPGLRGTRDVCAHQPRLLLPKEIRGRTHQCWSAWDEDKTTWHCLDLFGWEVFLGGNGAPDDARLSLTRLDHLLKESGQPTDWKLTAGLTGNGWRAIGGDYPLAASRVQILGGVLSTRFWQDKSEPPRDVLYDFSWGGGLNHKMASEVVLEFEEGFPGIRRIDGKKNVEVISPPENDPWTVVIENSCPPKSSTDDPSGLRDFMAYYNLCLTPQHLSRLPFPIRSSSPGFADDAQCSPAEHGRG